MKKYANPAAPYWARHVSPAEWRERVLELAPPLRGAVAAIVWWDMLSMKMHDERSDALDDLMGAANHVPPAALVAGLVTVGYPAPRAQARVFPTTGRASWRCRKDCQNRLTTQRMGIRENERSPEPSHE